MIKQDKIQTSLQNCVDDSLYSLKNAKQSNKTLYYCAKTSLMQAVISIPFLLLIHCRHSNRDTC